jgi:eukaryotic-like serine/threonine-protein kinase
MPANPSAARDIFLAAAELTANQRSEYLERACGGDAELRQRVDALLRAHDFQPTGDYTPLSANASEPDSNVGEGIGPYKLLQKLGEGGMGTVWLAEQSEPVRRKVAVKVIKAGMDSALVIARFEVERQALALMDHPNIAKILDAGTTEAGRPYFAMELVKGIPITKYCDQEHLTPTERLQLFIPACQAVQHAHQKGIIHRDLKPSNIMVGLYDGHPVPKIIDFGVAKATRQQLTERSLFTEIGNIIGTLEYMAPEQAELNNLDIDTRADIYSLGVILYELLAGSPPFSSKQLRGAAFTEMLRVIREVEPSKPSTKLSSSDELPSIAANRKLEPKRLAKIVHGDLDWIVMKCLEKDRGRRYETANGLAMELQRFLANEPVMAGPPARLYRMRKFLKRNRSQVIAATLLVGALFMGFCGTTWGLLQAKAAELTATTNATVARDAEKEARRSESDARSVLRFFEQRFLAVARPKGQEGGLGVEATIKQAVAATESQMATGFPDQPAVEASIRSVLGQTYIYLGDATAAVRHLDRSLDLFHQCRGADHPDALLAAMNLGVALFEAGDSERSLTVQIENLRRRETLFGSDHPESIQAANNLALHYVHVGKFTEAVPLLERLSDARNRQLGPDHSDALVTANNLALAYQRIGRVTAAISIYKEVMDLRITSLGLDHPYTISSRLNLATAYRDTGKFDLALPLAEDTLRQANDVLKDHPITLAAQNNLFTTYYLMGRIDAAINRGEETLTLVKKKLGPSHLNTQKVATNLANVYVEARRWDDAERLCRDAKPHVPPGGPDLANVLQILGECALATGRGGEADDLLRECQAIRARVIPDSWQCDLSMTLLGAALVMQKQFAEAESMLVRGYDGMKRHLAAMSEPVKQKRLAAAAEKLIGLYDAWDKPDEAAKWRKELAAIKITSDPSKP